MADALIKKSPDTTRYLITMVMTALLTIGGWSFGIIQLVRANQIVEVKKTAELALDTSRQNNAQLLVLAAQYGNIQDRLEDIYDLISKHMGIR